MRNHIRHERMDCHRNPNKIYPKCFQVGNSLPLTLGRVVFRGMHVSADDLASSLADKKLLMFLLTR